MKNIIITRRLGFFATFACAVHCLALPFLSIALPFVEHSFLHHPIIEVVLIGFGIVVGAYILLKDYKFHQKKITILLAILGFGLQLVSLFLEEENPLHRILAICGSLTLLSAYITNWRYSKRCKTH